MDCKVIQNTVLYGGRLISMNDGNLYINNTVFQKNFIEEECIGVFVE
jgi:hypothetical protein